MFWKVWKSTDGDLFVVEADSMDDALALARVHNPKLNTCQACTEKETAELKTVLTNDADPVHIISKFFADRYFYWKEG